MILKNVLLLALLQCTFAQEKEEKEENQNGFLKEIELLQDAKDPNNSKKEITKIPFIWPADIKQIKCVIFWEIDTLEVELKCVTNILNIHKGHVIFINNCRKEVWVQHVLADGTIYVSIISNIDKICVKTGDELRVGAILGQSDNVRVVIHNPHIKKKISIDMLFPFLKKDTIKVVNKITC